MKKTFFIISLFISVTVYAASPFIFGPSGPITLQPLSGVLRSVGNTITGGSTTDNLPQGSTNKYLTFPLNAPAGTLTAPTVNWVDNDTGFWQNGDGNISGSANGFLRFEINQNQVDIIGPLDVSGNITAANYPPVGTALAFAGYNNLGQLFSIPGWSFQDGSGAPSVYINRDITADGGFTGHNLELAIEQTATTNIGMNGLNLNTHFDRNNTGFDGGTMFGLNMDTRTEGGGYVSQLYGLNAYTSAGNGNNGGIGNVTGANFQTVVASGTSITGGIYGMFVGIDANSNTADNGYLINTNANNIRSTNNYNSIITSAQNSIFNNTFALWNGYTNNSNVFNGSYYGAIVGNDAPIAGFTYGFQAQMNGNMLQNITGHGFSTNANTLTSPGYNMTVFDGNISNTTFNGDNFNLLNGFIQGVGATQTNVNVISFNNQLSGTNRFTGVSIFNNQTQIEEIRLANFNTTGNARTQTGLDIVMNGNATDDGQGVRVNVSNLTSTTQHPKSAQFEGGIFGVQSNYKPFSGVGFEIGNNITATSNIDSGFPLTGSDQIIQLIQANLLANDDVSTGPFGLDTNMIGMVSQVVVGSGKTVPLLRSLLVGTSTPAGSGGTVTRAETLTLLGLPSFGGSVSNPTRIGIHLAGLVGQDFCGGANPATDCWGLYFPDAAARNWLKGGLVTGGTTGIPSGAYQLDIAGDSVFQGLIYSSDTSLSINSNIRLLYDNAANVSVSWNERRLKLASGITTVDWGTEQLRSSGNTVSVDWENRKLQDGAGNDSVVWNAADNVEIKDRHIKSTQSTPPVATVDANAGTAGTCTISLATDNAFHIQIVTDILSASGSQCSVAFNQAYGTAPICTWSPTNNNAGANAVFAYHSTSTSAFVMNFNVAGNATFAYEYDVHCLETQ